MDPELRALRLELSHAIQLISEQAGRIDALEARLNALAQMATKQGKRQKPTREERQAAAEEALIRLRDRMLGPPACVRRDKPDD